jgi:hypothetical protein
MIAIALSTLVLFSAHLHASTQFGGIHFHSSLKPSQAKLLSGDLGRLYKTPFLVKDEEFLKMTGLETGDGPSMHNWLLNRVQYVVGQDYKLESNLVFRTDYTFPQVGPISRPEFFNSMVVMSNIGAALYLVGKQQKTLLGLKFDGQEVFAKSPRVGILQVGEGLFYKNKTASPAHSISRLGTLFHEARHSDGKGQGVAFKHVVCPPGHNLAGSLACDKAPNGPYTVGAMSQRYMLKNCKKCTAKEKARIRASIVDSFGRVNVEIRRLIETQKTLIKFYSKIKASYEKKLKNRKLSAAQKQKIRAEMDILTSRLERYKADLVKFESDVASVFKPYDVTPEGEFEAVTLERSQQLMEASLKP